MPSDSTSKNAASGGGRATAGGVEYQARVAAYFCVKILAEIDTALVAAWDLDVNETLEAIDGETVNEVDDLLIHTSGGRRIFVNVKHTLSNSASETSDFGKAIDQLVRQFLQNAETG